MNPLSSIITLVDTVISRIFPDKTEAAKAKIELTKMQLNGELAQLASDANERLAQIAVNAEEAKSSNLFVAGWRPFLGWSCGFAYVFNYIIGPFVIDPLLLAFGKSPLPKMDFSDMIYVLMGMLGLGGMRSYEKIKGVK